MEKYLILENIRFVIMLFGALTFGGMSWLYFDAIVVKKQLNVWLSAIGSALIAIAFLAVILGIDWSSSLRFLGYLVLGIGVWTKPMSSRPKMGKAEVVNSFWLMEIKTWMLPLLPGWVGLGYFRLGTVGLERHLSRLGVGMYLLLVAEVLEYRKLFVGWSDPRIYLAASEFGLFWVLHLLFLFLGLLVVATWVFSYLLKRFETQLTLFLCIMTIFAFAVATIGFSFTSAKHIEGKFIDYQKMTLELLRYSEERRAQEMIFRAKDLGVKSGVVELFGAGSGENAKRELLALQKNGGLSGIWVLGLDGKVLASLSNGSVADWAVFGRAVKGESVWGYEVEGGVMSLAVAVPITSGTQNSGVVVLSKRIDSNFLQEMSAKVKNGLWVYKQNQIVASADTSEKVRLLTGFVENNLDFNKYVLANGADTVLKDIVVSGESYVGVWGAMKNANGTPIGSLAVVSRSDDLWKIVSVALAKDYQLAVLSLILSLLPAVAISRYFVKQLV